MRRYGFGAHPVLIEVERKVLGSDYGSTSWTDLAQARQMTADLRLGPTSLLLDVGSGSGWPGLFLAAESGCRALLTDLPSEGLTQARSRATQDGLIDRVGLVRARGSSLSFADETFDAVSHSDVLC